MSGTASPGERGASRTPGAPRNRIQGGVLEMKNGLLRETWLLRIPPALPPPPFLLPSFLPSWRRGS